MNDGPAARQGRVSPRAAALAFAAILLVLHWILPGAWLAGAASDWRGAGSGHWSGSSVVQPLDLPRLQPRVGGLQSALPKPAEDDHAPGVGPAGLLLAGDGTRPPGRLLAETVPTVAIAHRIPTSAFDARGPPRRG